MKLISLTSITILMSMIVHVYTQLDFPDEGDLGQNCQDDYGCYHSFICFQGKCARKGDYGQPCKTINDCFGAFVCNKGYCGDRNYLPIGATCEKSTECQFSCGADHKCSGQPGNAGCGSDDKCPSGWYCNAGTCIER